MLVFQNNKGPSFYTDFMALNCLCADVPLSNHSFFSHHHLQEVTSMSVLVAMVAVGNVSILWAVTGASAVLATSLPRTAELVKVRQEKI